MIFHSTLEGYSAHRDEIIASRDLPREELCPQFTQECLLKDLGKINLPGFGVAKLLKSSDRPWDSIEREEALPLLTPQGSDHQWNTPPLVADRRNGERGNLLTLVRETFRKLTELRRDISLRWRRLNAQNGKDPKVLSGHLTIPDKDIVSKKDVPARGSLDFGPVTRQENHEVVSQRESGPRRVGSHGIPCPITDRAINGREFISDHDVLPMGNVSRVKQTTEGERDKGDGEPIRGLREVNGIENPNSAALSLLNPLSESPLAKGHILRNSLQDSKQSIV
jgi:hypothetical protein